MKILLVAINAKYIHTNNAIRLLKANSDFDIELLDMTIKDSVDDIISNIHTFHADIIGFSLYIWNISLFRKIIEKMPFQGSKIILGGPEVSYDSEEFLNNPNIDYLIKGEGETSFNQLLHALHNQTPVTNIPGLTYRFQNQIRSNPIQEIKDLSTIKFPHYLLEDIPHIKNKIAYIESSRGCPYRCSYCLSSLEKTVRFFPLEEVKRAILYVMDKGAKTVKFLDRTFNANKHTFDLFDFIIKQHNHQTVFQFEITGDTLDSSIVQYVNDHAPKGLFRFEIGIQSTNETTNILVDRIQNKDKLFSTIRDIQNGGVIDLHLDLIAGLPEEDLDSFRTTFNDVFSLGAKELQLGFLKMLKGTKIRKEAHVFGYLFEPDAPYTIIEHNKLSKQDLEEIQLVETMLDIFHNKGYFDSHTLDYIMSYKTPYDFFLDIGTFYQHNDKPLKGYQISDVYTILQSFIHDESLFEPIKIDYYSRSKVKPKDCFHDDISVNTKQSALLYINQTEHIPMHLLFKHTRIISVASSIYVFYYSNLSCTTYQIQKSDILS